eukprot:COSAG02_NODE_217_length_28595_cov_19.642371_2_plen_347_part_00
MNEAEGKQMAQHPENAGLRLELEAIQGEIATLRSQLGIVEGVPQRRSPWIAEGVPKRRSPRGGAAQRAAAAAAAAAAAEGERSTGTAEAGAGAGTGTGLQRSFSAATYDKMLANPKLNAAQREKITAMRERRAAKEAVLESSMTELVRTASPATQAALREAMAGLEEARCAAGFEAPATAKASPAPAPGESVTALVRTASAATQAALRQSMEELAEYKRSQGLAWGAPEPEPEPAANQQSLTGLMRTASPAAHAALQQSMHELAEAKRAFPHQSSSPRPLPVRPDDDDSMKRQFSTEMYDKMLKNPRLPPEQREKLEVMRTRRQAQEDASTTTMTVRSYVALHTCM